MIRKWLYLSHLDKLFCGFGLGEGKKCEKWIYD